jgi:hypothetical protein
MVWEVERTSSRHYHYYPYPGPVFQPKEESESECDRIQDSDNNRSVKGRRIIVMREDHGGKMKEESECEWLLDDK